MAPRPARAAAPLVVLLVLLTAAACRERPPTGGPVTLVFKHAKILGPADPVPGLLRRFEALHPGVRVQSEEAVTQIVERFADHRRKGHLAPIYEAITNSPKDELAQIAAWLVNLNSQQKRMSMGPETVGGPIDVAVISKGDGFIWIDRKHYFRSELNHHFFRNYDAKLLRGRHHDKETQSV